MRETSGILKGVNGSIKKRLGNIDFSTKTSCQNLSRNPLPNLNVHELIRSIYRKIYGNWNKKPSRSTENWRWKPNTELPGSTIEVQLERKLVGKSKGGWINQVPTSSGLTDGRADTRCAIDLVQWCKDGWYEFIELKVRSNTPLFAAMEILQYGTLYIFSRDHRDEDESGRKPHLGYKPHENPLLYGEGVHLRVLAPENYYKYKVRGKKDPKLYRFKRLEKKINDGLQAFLSEKNRDFGITFSFENFTNEDDWLKNPVGTVSKRTRVYPISS